MISAETTVDVDASAAEAWAVVADYGRDVEWRRGVRSMVPTPAGPVRPGTTTAEVLRVAGRTTYNDAVVTDVEAGRRFAWRTTSGIRAEGLRAVVPLDAETCRVVLTTRVHPPGLFRLVPGVVARVLRRGLQRDAVRLRVLIELGETDR